MRKLILTTRKTQNKMTLVQAKVFADIFQALSIGIAALLGGFGALKILEEWNAKRKLARQKRRWLRMFPKDKLGEDFKLIRPISSDHVYICDNRSKSKHWIINMKTLTLLGFNSDQINTDYEFKNKDYKPSDTIDLT